VPTLSAASLRQVIAAMQLLYDHAQDDGVVPKGHNPWRDLRRADRPKLPSESSTDFLEVHEAHALLEASGRVERRVLPLRTIVAALLLTGGRKDEVLGLEVSDVDFRRQTVRFRTNRWRGIKTAEERTVPLWPQLAHELRAYLARRPRIGGLLFPSPHATDPGPGGHTRSPEEHMITGLSRAFDDIAALAAADLATRYGPAVAAAFAAKRVNARSLRPTYCAARLQTTDRGEPVAVWTVRGEMGHSSLRMIDRVYGRLGQVRHRSPVVEFVAVDPGAADVHAANWKR
jgi:integrase